MTLKKERPGYLTGIFKRSFELFLVVQIGATKVPMDHAIDADEEVAQDDPQ